MAFCQNCGKKIDDGKTFCSGCESAAGNHTVNFPFNAQPSAEENQEGFLRKRLSGLNSASGGIFSFAASQVPGEVAAGVLPSVSGIINVFNPFSVILGGIKRVFTGFAAVFKDKKRLIPAIVLAVSWIILSLLPMLGINNVAVKLLSLLTFAGGGYSGSIAGIIGGLIGKGMVASVFMSLFSGELKGIAGGAKQIFSSFKTSAGDASLFCFTLLGAGASMIFYNFTVERASVWQDMAGVAGCLICLRAIGTGKGFLNNLISSLTAKRSAGERHENAPALTALISGMTCGFAFAVLMSPIPFAYAPYCVGVAFTAVSLVSILILKLGKGGIGE